ncbi:MAG TPA: TRAP transporter small permease, partial [Clostridiales bacterium]|nr:TRAP transporter small permease [Clostridiales bacterium]
MFAIKWLDEHLEEALMVILLGLISCIMMAQIIAR